MYGRLFITSCVALCCSSLCIAALSRNKKKKKKKTSSLNNACPLTPARTVNKNNPWFTPQLKQLRKEVGAAYLKKNANNTEQHTKEYKDRLKRYKRLIMKTKKAHHAKYVDSIQNEEEMSFYVKGLLKQKTAAKPPP